MREPAGFVEAEREDGQDLVAVDHLRRRRRRPGSDRRRRRARCPTSAPWRPPRPTARRGDVEPQPVVDVQAVGVGADRDDVRAGPPSASGAICVGGAVRAVDHDPQPGSGSRRGRRHRAGARVAAPRRPGGPGSARARPGHRSPGRTLGAGRAAASAAEILCLDRRPRRRRAASGRRAPKNLMPLSGVGLWLAESITPNRPRARAVRYATAGVGMTPSRSTSTPAPASPATTAASRNSPEARGSRPTRASGRRPAALGGGERRQRSPRRVRRRDRQVRWRVARQVRVRDPANAIRAEQPAHRRANLRWSSQVTPGRLELALGVLRRLAGLLQTVLLALLDPGVAGEEAGLLQGRAVLGIDQRSAPGRCRGAAHRPARTMPPPVMRARRRTAQRRRGPTTAHSRAAGEPCSGSSSPGCGR